MRKRVILGSLVLIVLLFIVTGCNEADYSGDFPPEPAPPVGDPSAVPSEDLGGKAVFPFEVGFAPPYDVYNDDPDPAKAQLFFLTKNDVDLLGFEEDTFTFPFKVEHPGGVVYKYGYVYTIPRGWERYEFPQPGFRGSKWIVTKAETTLTLNRADFEEGTNWIVAYSCKKQAGKWRCGMQQKDVVCDPVNNAGCWMLQSFTVRNVGAPAEPSALENVCTDTDGGKVAGTRGTTTGIFVDGTTRVGGSATDECVAGTNKVKEWYCPAPTTLPTRAFEEVECANGCENGACKAAGTPAPTTAQLTITKAGTGAGTVSSTSNPTQADQITNCDGTAATDCSAVYPAQTSVTLTAAPTSGATVTWSESACTGNTCVVTTGTTEKTVTVTFTAAAVGPTGTVVCEIPLVDFGGATDPNTGAYQKTSFTTAITSTNAKAKCEQYQVFGTSASDAFTISDNTKLAGEIFQKALLGKQYDWLRCTLTCVPAYDQVTKCKDLSASVFTDLVNKNDADPNNDNVKEPEVLTDAIVNSADAKAQIYVAVLLKPSTVCP